MAPAANKSARKIYFMLGVSVLSWLLCRLPCYAALGGDLSSVRDDQARIHASLQVSQTSAYSVHELRSSTGQVIREYAAPSGNIFAVTWHGPWAPDLRQLLGSHFMQFQQAMQSSSRAAHGPLVMQQGNLVVELGGHMRDFMGRAYLSDQLPTGVRAEEIR
ncbi:MAG TPA: DUF2844 domain-containing protein [Candidatus Sulfotelmatobacter sp.]|nr:DUF2844 domain-containing protein [Candidatus Sulfotelmatobacter sp.]